MLDQEAFDRQQELLSAYRRTLAHWLRQAAQYGGVVYAPPQTANGIDEARQQIKQIKATLRAQDAHVVDHPDDEAPASAAPEARQQSPAAPRDPIAPLAQVAGAAASSRPLRVFLCHSSGDKPAVRALYGR